MNSVARKSSLPRQFSRAWLLSSLALVLLLLAGCATPMQPPASAAVPPPPTSQPVVAAPPAESQAVTLHFAVSDGEGHAAIDPYVHEFVEQVHALSQGNITIELVWGAGDGTFDGYEKGTLQRVLQGKYDLGFVASRTWDSEGITNFQALHAPFLISNDALAEAVASGAIGKRMLDSLSDVGLVGLTLWPEDMRHPFSVVPDKPLLSPQDFAGLHIRTPLSDVSYQMIDALGAMPMTGDGGYEGAESGLRQGGTLTGRPIATGNVTFYSKYQVIFANANAFNRLSDEQRTILRQAAVATQTKAIAEHPHEVDTATAYCADGGTIVLASAEQVAAFEKAAQPVFDNLAQDPFNAEMIAAIRDLKAHTTPSAGAEACAPVATAPSPAPSADAQVWSAGLPPNGVWQVALTTDEFEHMGLLHSGAVASAGVYTWTFQDGESVESWQGEQGQSVQCEATYSAVKDVVRITNVPSTSTDCAGVVYDIQWRLDDDGLHLHLVALENGGPLFENSTHFEAKPWQKVEVWSPGLPPNGVWQVTFTSDELVQLGMLRSAAPDWAGVTTWTFQDGKYHVQWVGEQGQTGGGCTATYAVVDDFVRITRTPVTADCPTEVDDIQWRLDDDGLHLHLVATNGQLFEARIATDAKPWQKVEPAK